MPDIEGEFTDPDAPQEVNEEGELIGAELAEPERIDRAAFWVVFETGFSMPGMFQTDLAPLAIQPEEKPTARAASDAVYSLLEIYYPKALMPGSETLAHVMIAGPFIAAKLILLRTILAHRRAERLRPVNRPAANDNRQPAADQQYDWLGQGQAA
ncbi:hypothetical protein G5B38_02375 [Pseudohalocynthiibacter aestuariivivens]|nr:hypothetical protein [Pseudohalocynthiibacter aestuariivivens]QIE44464.1 hypothetical protein G5B38_02375 [Pseudohalocynthiibacter aestuariivivens]